MRAAFQMSAPTAGVPGRRVAASTRAALDALGAVLGHGQLRAREWVATEPHRAAGGIYDPRAVDRTDREAGGLRAKSQRHGKVTADRWNQ